MNLNHFREQLRKRPNLCESLAAVLTLVRPLISVNPFMHVQVMREGEFLATCPALKRTFVLVCFFVLLEVTEVVAPIVTFGAAEGLVLGMRFDMPLQGTPLIEPLIAGRALKYLFLFQFFNIFSLYSRCFTQVGCQLI